jgi:molecular chaperone Hsp33
VDVLGAGDDLIQPFMIETSGLHGRLVRLGPAVDTPLSAHEYPEPVAALLGEAMALVAGLSGSMKFDGVFSLQTRGDGPVNMMVADVTTDGDIRGYASIKGPLPMEDLDAPVPRLLGAGHLAFTVDQGPDTEQYQGIVEVQGATLADCTHHYFRQSSQFNAAVKLACQRDTAGRWRGGALVLQRSPEDEDPYRCDELEDGWRSAMAKMGSCTAAELCDPELDANSLLYRIFHEDGVRVFDPRRLKFACKCSGDRMKAAVAMLTETELEEMTVDGNIVVTCQFCNAKRVFDPLALQAS